MRYICTVCMLVMERSKGLNSPEWLGKSDVIEVYSH